MNLEKICAKIATKLFPVGTILEHNENKYSYFKVVDQRISSPIFEKNGIKVIASNLLGQKHNNAYPSSIWENPNDFFKPK